MQSSCKQGRFKKIAILFKAYSKPVGVLYASVVFSLFISSTSFSQTIPNTQQSSPGTLLSGPVDPDMGRLSVIHLLGNNIITVPETPGSEPGDHQLTQAWDISDPRNPLLIGNFGRTGNPILAHGGYSRGNEVFIGFNAETGNDTVRLNSDGSLSHARWSGPTAPELFQRIPNQPGVAGQRLNLNANWSSKGAMMQPWAINDNWSYNSPNNTATLTLRNILMAEWNITADTGGASGFGSFLGNLLIYVSDQLRGGVAIYDATDIITQNGISRPRLLDTFNLPASDGGVGGYWSEISGHYIVIGRERVSNQPNSFDGIQVINFEDPSNIRLQCQTELVNPNADQSFALESRPRYPGLQDEFAFVDNFKVNIETCEVETILDVTGGPRGNNLCIFRPNTDNLCPQRIVDTGEYNRVVGNLVISGGFPVQPNIDGMSIWPHQSAPDTRAPFIAHQVPAANQTNYPIDAPLGFSIPETLRLETIVTSENREAGETDSVTITAVQDNGDLVDTGPEAVDYVLHHHGILTLNPVNLLADDTTYEVSFTNQIQDAVGNRLQATRFRFSTGDSVIQANGDTGPVVEDGDPAIISNVSVTPSNNVFINQPLTITVTSPNADSYQIALDSENINFSTQNSRTFEFSNAGNIFINVRARNENGDSSLQRISIQVRANGLEPGRNSSQLSCDADNNSVWAVNPDNDTVAVLRANDLTKLDELSGVDDPQSAALVNDEIWVTSRNSDEIVIYDANTRLELRRINTGYGSTPSHILASNDEQFMYVTFYGSGQLARYRTNGNSDTPELITLEKTVQAMALNPDGSRLFIARFISPENWGEVFEIDSVSWTLNRTFRLDKHLIEDSLNEGRGKPNYLASIVVNGSGDRAYISGKKDNTDRGLLNSDLDLDPDNSVRTIIATLDLENNQELRNERIDLDNTSSLSGLAMSSDSQTLFVAEQGRNAIRTLQIGADLRFTGQITSFSTGLAPQGLCFDNERDTLFVKNFTDRSVTSLDLSSGISNPTTRTTSTVENEALSSSELSGLQLFYNAFAGLTDSQPVGLVSAEGYISCASCHIDGGHDGNTWDFTGRGEGLRNNISLKGRGGVRFGNVHWSANFDEIQDFEQDIRGPFGGLGFLTNSQFSNTSPLGSPKTGLSQDLDNLAAYVSSLGRESLPRSSNRSSGGNLSNNANSGQSTFINQGCAQCHSGSAFSDNLLHDVGTLRSSSGQRLNEVLTGIKTPSLLGMFDSAPYLHDGSAKTIEDVFRTVGGTRFQFDTNESGTFDFNGETVTQANFSYLRDGVGVRLNGDNALVGRFNNYSNGVAGPGKIRIRYGSSITGGQLEISIADEIQTTVDLDTLPQVEGQDVSFTESRGLDITLPQNGFNITIRYRGSSSVIIDEFTVSNADDLAKAEPHLGASRLSSQARGDLVSFIGSIDQQSAPDDNEVNIFDNAGDNIAEVEAETCFPVQSRSTQELVIICF